MADFSAKPVKRKRRPFSFKAENTYTELSFVSICVVIIFIFFKLFLEREASPALLSILRGLPYWLCAAVAVQVGKGLKYVGYLVLSLLLYSVGEMFFELKTNFESWAILFLCLSNMVTAYTFLLTFRKRNHKISLLFAAVVLNIFFKVISFTGSQDDDMDYLKKNREQDHSYAIEAYGVILSFVTYFSVNWRSSYKFVDLYVFFCCAGSSFLLLLGEYLRFVSPDTESWFQQFCILILLPSSQLLRAFYPLFIKWQIMELNSKTKKEN